MYTFKKKLNHISLFYDINNPERNEKMLPSKNGLDTAMENADKNRRSLQDNLENTNLDAKVRIAALMQTPEGRQAMENVMLQSGIKTQDEIHAMPIEQQKGITDWMTQLAGNIKKNPTAYQQQKAEPIVQKSELSQDQIQKNEYGLSFNGSSPKQGGAEKILKTQPLNSSNTIGNGGTRISGEQLFDKNSNNIGTNRGQNGLDFKKTYSQSGANTLRDQTGNVQSQGANIDIGNGYKINIVDVQNGRYKFEGQTVKDSRNNTLPINKEEFMKMTQNIRRV